MNAYYFFHLNPQEVCYIKHSYNNKSLFPTQSIKAHLLMNSISSYLHSKILGYEALLNDSLVLYYKHIQSSISLCLLHSAKNMRKKQIIFTSLIWSNGIGEIVRLDKVLSCSFALYIIRCRF